MYSFVASDFVLVPVMIKYEPVSWSHLASLKPDVWTSLAAIAIFSLVLAMILFLWVLQRLDAMQASLSIYLLPVFGVILSALAVKEKITMRLLLGGGLVLAGTFLVTVYEAKGALHELIEDGDSPRELEPANIPVGVVGLGLMGTSIATCLLAAGHQ